MHNWSNAALTLANQVDNSLHVLVFIFGCIPLSDGSSLAPVVVASSDVDGYDGMVVVSVMWMSIQISMVRVQLAPGKLNFFFKMETCVSCHGLSKPSPH